MSYSLDTRLFSTNLHLNQSFALSGAVRAGRDAAQNAAHTAAHDTLHRHLGTTHQPTCLGDLPNFDYAVDEHVLTRAVVAEFERAPDLPGAIILQAGQYAGLLSRQRCLQHLSRPFGLEVFLRRPVLHLYATLSFNSPPLPAVMPISEAVEYALNREVHDRYEPLAVELPGHVVRVLDLHTLLLAQSQLLAAATRTVEHQAAIGRALSSTLDLSEVLDLILSHIGESVPFDRASALLLRDRRLQWAAARGFPAEVDRERLVADFEASQAYQQILESRRALIMNEAAHWPDWPTQPALAPVRAWLGVPIVQADNWLGVIALARLSPTPFTAEEVAQVESITLQAAALALQNALLYEASRDTNEMLEQRVQERTQELIKANRAKDEFVANVSHEFRTPLANIQLYVRLLDDGKAEKRPQYLDTLRRETTRLNRLIEDLLNLHDLDNNHQSLKLVPLEVNRVVRSLADEWRSIATERELRLDVRLDHLLPLASADATLVTHILTNLLSNAFNYTPVGGIIRLDTGVKQRADRAWVTIEVHDTGHGITDKDLPHIFERFYRGEAARHFRSPGTGLGLSICQTSAERLGGFVTVESQVGLGSTFTLWLQTRAAVAAR